VERRLHERLQKSFDHHLGDTISNRWYPQRPRFAVAFRYVHPPDRRRKVAARRHPIPELVEVVRKINLEVFDRLTVYSGRTLVGFYPFVGFPYTSRFGMSNGFALSTGFLPSLVVRAEELKQRNPFGPVPLQNLQPYYGSLRPCASLRYSYPHGGCPFGCLPSHRGDRFPRSTRKPDVESRHLHAGCRLGCNQAIPQTCPGLTTSPRFRHRLYAFDTSSVVCFRSSLHTVPDGIMSRLFHDVHHGGSLPSQLVVV
jgi:hypothetical protein